MTLDFSLPRPALPAVDEAMLVGLVGPAITIALLGAIESLLSAVVADGMIGGRHRTNTELIAQGVANVVTPIFGGIPATGAIARTATNIKNGGRTPVAGIVHALTLLAITLFAAPFAARIPLAALAAILVIVSWHMSEASTFVAELRTAPRSDSAVMVTTFLLTVLVDLTVALSVGMVLAAFLFMKRMAEVSSVQAISREMLDREDAEASPETLREVARAGAARGRGLRHQRTLLLRRRGDLQPSTCTRCQPSPRRSSWTWKACPQWTRPGSARSPRSWRDRRTGARRRSSWWACRLQPRELILALAPWRS